MYLPSRFKLEDENEILALARENPLATLISVKDNEPFVSHIPLVIEKREDKFVLIGHFAKANSHWKLIEDPTTAIFHGPNAYITPQWYPQNDVPTWNYAVVHMRGRGRLLHDFESIVSCLKKLTEQVEPKSGWEFWIPEDLADPGRLTSAVIGFEIEVDRKDVKAKFKLSQHRSATENKGVIDALMTKRKDEDSHRLAELMRRISLGGGN